MPELVKDRWYYESMDDSTLRESARWSDHPLVQVLYDRWVGAKDAYSDEHARAIDWYERENAEQATEIERLETLVAELNAQLDDPENKED